MLSVLSLAETQEDVYYRAMQAEADGDVSKSLELFEQAAAMDGEYTDEIKEIVKEYREALGLDEPENPWAFHFSGDVAYYGLRYDEFGGASKVKEYGGDLSSSLSAYLDYSTKNWSHSFGVGVTGDYFFANDDMPVLDTNDWTLAPGLEYMLMGRVITLDLGMDFNLASEADMQLDFYSWFEATLHKFGNQKIGVALWGYYQQEGPLTAALYGTWHRTVPEGFNGNVSIGVKFDADSLADYIEYWKAQDEYYANQYTWYNDSSWYDSTYANMWQQYNDSAWNPGTWDQSTWDQTTWDQSAWNQNGWNTDSLYQNPAGETQWNANAADQYQWTQEDWEQYAAQYAAQQGTWQAGEEPRLKRYWVSWIGPTLKSRFVYRFKNRMSLEAKLNLFYGFVVNAHSDEYEKLRKLSGTWGLQYNWRLWLFTIYGGVEQNYLRYEMPKALKGIFPKESLLSEFKVGFKFDI